MSYFSNHIDDMVRMDGVTWRFTGLYGYPKSENKPKTGELLKALYNDDDPPWLCGGDLNLMLWSNEKQGRSDFKFEEATILREALDHYKLEDLHFMGHPFTWTNNQGGDKNLQERLDSL